MDENPRVGLVLIRAGWTKCGKARETLESIDDDAGAILRQLQENLRFTILGPWVVDSLDTLQDCQKSVAETDLDMLVLAFQTVAEDTQIIALLEAVGSRPLVLWCYVPWRQMPRPVAFGDMLRSSGPVGAFAALGMLRNLRVPFLFTWGAPEDPRLVRDLRVAGRAARVRQALRQARFGVIPTRNEGMQSMLVDISRLMADFGPEVRSIPVDAYLHAARSLDPRQVDAYLSFIRREYPIQDISAETLERAGRAAQGLARLAVDQQLDVVAINDSSQELRRAFHLRPSLYPDPALLDGQAAAETLYLPEADLGAATAAFILHRLTGSPVMFLEFWFWDEALNQLVGGHGGLQNPAVAGPGSAWISEDLDYCQDPDILGAQIQLIARPGRVTLFQLRNTPDGWQAIAASGVCLESRPVVEGYPHAIVRLDSPIDHLLNLLADVGATQHWIMAYGSVLHEIEAFCEMEEIPLEILRN